MNSAAGVAKNDSSAPADTDGETNPVPSRPEDRADQVRPFAFERLAIRDMAQAVLAARITRAGVKQDAIRSLAEPVSGLDPDPAAALAQASLRLEERLRNPAAQADAYHTMVRAFRLSPMESDLLLLALWPHLDERLGEALRSWTGSAGPLRVRDVIGALLPAHAPRSVAVKLLGSSVLWDGGLFRAADGALSVFERPMVPCPALAAGWTGLWPRHLETGAEVRLPDPPTDVGQLMRTCTRYAEGMSMGVRLLQSDIACLLRLESTRLPGADRESMAIETASILAAMLGCPLFVAVHRDGPWARTLRESEVLALLTGALPLVLHAPEREESAGSPVFEPSGPFLWHSPVAGMRIETRRAASRRWTLPRLRADERSALWKHIATEAGGEAEYDVLGLQACLDFRSVAQVISLASRLARERPPPVSGAPEDLSGPALPRPAFNHTHVETALRQVRPAPLTSMGHVRWPSKGFEDLIVDREARAQLHGVAVRLKHMVEVEVRWGLGGGSDTLPGLTLLLHGESGTGKTLAAEALARSVSLPLLSADLSQVVSKYIGETEKQIEQLLRVAEGYRAVLFFDEADALFGKRTGVRDSHDRYANIEVDFLLQRLERFEGLVVLATNLQQNLDEAFLRRIHMSVHFPRPNPAMRRRLWQIHLPAQRLAEGIDFDALSRRYDLVGGDIRNAVADAAYRAASDGGVITQAHLNAAIQEEFRKKGRPAPVP